MNKRFIDADLNRVFKFTQNQNFLNKNNNYELYRSEKLKEIMNEVEVLLDIHSSSTIDSRPFIICEKNAYDIARLLPATIIVSGFDMIQPGGVDYYMNSIGKTGICVECGHHVDSQSIKHAIDSIYSFLSVRGHLNNQILNECEKEYFNVNTMYCTKSDNFRLVKNFSDFEILARGALVGFDGVEEIKVIEKESIILFAEDSVKIGSEVFMLGSKQGKT